MTGNVGERIKQVRLFFNKSQEEFGALMGVSQSRQSRIEKGEAEITQRYLDRVMEHYHEYINEDWLYLGKGIMEKDQTMEPDKVNYFAELEAQDLSEEEYQILAEVKQFSDFLRSRSWSPHVKRLLLELLIESIDQAIEPPQRDQDHS